MRRILRNVSFLLCLMVLLALAVACAATWSRAYVRMEQNESRVKLFMSHRGQVRWFSFQIFDAPWKISKSSLAADGGSIQLNLRGRSEVLSSSRSAGSISLSGAMMTKPLTEGYLPYWWSVTVARQAIGDTGPDLPPQRMKELQIPYWPALMIALVCTAFSSRLVLKHFLSCRRAKAGLCPACAYDLRATPDCCPECGLVVAAGA